MIKKLSFYTLIFLLPSFAAGQDCCAPGGGGLSQITAGAGGDGRSFILPRHYRIRKSHLGIDVGTEGGLWDIAGERIPSLSPRLEYNGALGNLDFYGTAIYTLSFESALGHQVDFAENIGYTLDLPGVSALIFRVDNEDIITLSSGEPEFAYGAVSPGITLGKQFGFGGLTIETGFPIGYGPEYQLASYLTLGYEHPSGFKTGISSNFGISPDGGYNGAGLTFSYIHERFYGTIAFSADKNFESYGIRPYGEFFINRLTFWVGADIQDLGGETTSVSPYIGIKYNF